MIFAPVALFVYNRPWHTRQTIEALLLNEGAAETQLYIFSDAPKSVDASKAVKEVREYIKGITGFKAVSILVRNQNFGLAKSIIDGVTQVCHQHGRVIVLEDDLVTSKYFLRYMNSGLIFYEKDERVIGIHGYVYPIKPVLPETFFLTGADCWGWATWKRGWDLFECDGQKLLSELMGKKLTRRFDYDGSYPHTRMLKDQVEGKNESWAIRWHASAYVRGMLTLYPKRSLVKNIGFDNSGTHCKTNDFLDVELSNSPISVDVISVREHKVVRSRIVRFLFLSRIMSFLSGRCNFFVKTR